MINNISTQSPSNNIQFNQNTNNAPVVNGGVRTNYGDEVQKVATKKNGSVKNQKECKTCKERRYQDGSNDPGVSMKSPTSVSPEASAAAVKGHEQEHVTRNQAKADSEGREVISSSVKIFTAICPECGKVYVSGGETKTVTAKRKKKANPQGEGGNVDMFI